MKFTAEQIADFIIKFACENADNNGFCSVTVDDVCIELGMSKDDVIDIHGYVTEELCERDEICDLNDIGNGDLDIWVYSEFCKGGN